jgi:hypothetical protein
LFRVPTLTPTSQHDSQALHFLRDAASAFQTQVDAHPTQKLFRIVLPKRAMEVRQSLSSNLVVNCLVSVEISLDVDAMDSTQTLFRFFLAPPPTLEAISKVPVEQELAQWKAGDAGWLEELVGWSSS